MEENNVIDTQVIENDGGEASAEKHVKINVKLDSGVSVNTEIIVTDVPNLKRELEVSNALFYNKLRTLFKKAISSDGGVRDLDEYSDELNMCIQFMLNLGISVHEYFMNYKSGNWNNETFVMMMVDDCLTVIEVIMNEIRKFESI